MKKIFTLLAVGFFMVSNAHSKSASAPKKAVAKKAKKKKRAEVRVPAAVLEPVVQVHSEKTNFEDLVRRQDEMSRRPAGFVGNARVIALRRELGLTRSEADSAPQDIVMNAGYKEGISEGMVLNVARKIPVLDPYNDNQQGELNIQFASIRVVHVEEGLAIARVEKMDPVRSGVGIGTRGVLVGDYVGTVK